MSAANPAVKKGFKVPHTFVIMFTLVILAAVGSYVITPGVYDRVKDERTGRVLVDPNSFHTVEPTPVSLFQLFAAIPEGLVAGADISFFIFICGGVFTVLQATGAIDAGLNKAILAVRGKEKMMIPFVMLVFAFMGATMGMSEEVVIFVPIGVALARAVGYDDIVALAMLSTGAAIGFSSGLANPFTVGVAQGIADVPLFSGFSFRLVGFVLLYTSAVWYTLWYANRIKQDPTKSYMYGVEQQGAENARSLQNVEITARHKVVLLVSLLFLAYMLYGVMKLGYYIMELATVFAMAGIVGGLLGGLSPSEIARKFVQGCSEITFGALAVGVSRGILITLQNGQIIDSIVHYLATLVEGIHSGVSAIIMFLVQTVISVFIPSGSGMAAATMPIMAPLGDVIGLTRQTTVVAFHYADGFSNSIIPTSGGLMAVLAMAKVPYEKWVRFFWPIMVIWTVIGCVMCYAAAIIKLGPF